MSTTTTGRDRFERQRQRASRGIGRSAARTGQPPARAPRAAPPRPGRDRGPADRGWRPARRPSRDPDGQPGPRARGDPGDPCGGPHRTAGPHGGAGGLGEPRPDRRRARRRGGRHLREDQDLPRPAANTHMLERTSPFEEGNAVVSLLLSPGLTPDAELDDRRRGDAGQPHVDRGRWLGRGDHRGPRRLASPAAARTTSAAPAPAALASWCRTTAAESVIDASSGQPAPDSR